MQTVASSGNIGFIGKTTLNNPNQLPRADQQADLPTTVYDSGIFVKDSLLFYPGADRSLVVWDMDNQKELARLVGHDKPISAIAARENMAVSVQYDGHPRLWNLEALQCTAKLPYESILSCVCCMEGRVLLGANDGLIKVWDVAASAPVALADLEGHTGPVIDIKASANTILFGSADKTVQLWDLRSGECVRIMEGHSDYVWSVDMDGHCRTAVSGSRDTTVRLWDLGSGRCSATFEGHLGAVRDVVMHESGSSFLSLGMDDVIVNAWAVGSSKASMRADLRAFFPHTLPLSDGCSRLFACRDLSTVAYCGFTLAKMLELRRWTYR